ncbi:MAG: hypothetical protein NVS9B12_02040 [Vulcanimicrobiaceae bacterium]
MSVAGIVDVRALRPAARYEPDHDALAYLLAGAGCAMLAAHAGNTLVNPRFILPLWGSAAALLLLGLHHRRAVRPALRTAPAIMLAASVLNAPPPVYYASETTLPDAFAGEQLLFRGAIARKNQTTSIARYEITCCRADAQPVVLRLQGPIAERDGQWVAARGTLVRTRAGLALAVAHYDRIAAPADPFLYR